ncbi:MAG: putative ATPase associated with diverse cellular [Nocardia sp.]|uniref:AAA family ATPase n=1 Tax=Nocardia sp. TaxID=1821 RepID=UPI00261B62C4|nr:AAA family ATPase [Nocardia sp.]MCU1642193.1 putative ATPase associated with diverse cellular [Nocardia sp.]
MAGAQTGGGYLRAMRLERGTDPDEYPFSLPAVQYLGQAGGLTLAPGVTFFVGENGSGKSTLVEAMAVAAGMNPEGGSQNYRFTTRSTESVLGEHLVLSWSPRKPRSRFFLRAESYYNVATETEALGPEQLAVFGGVSPHQRSHGESFVDLMRHRFYPNGLYLLDEPEAALSPRACMAVLAMLSDLVAQQCQLVISTHSPILLALPGATIYEISETGDINTVTYDEALPVRLTRDFLADPNRYLRHLVDRD